ncbi:MAG: DUF2339 domain-containing protein [bacterium]
MAQQDIVIYITKERAIGHSFERITAKLLEVGWTKREVELAINDAKLQEESQDIQTTLRKLQQSFLDISNRLTRIETQLTDGKTPLPAAAKIPEENEQSFTSPAFDDLVETVAETKTQSALQKRSEIETIREISQTDIPHTVEAKQPEPHTVPKVYHQKTKETENWETKITGKWFAGLGIVALLFGIGFLLKYAFDHNLILPIMRVFLGFLAGAALMGLGAFLSKKEKYRQYSFFLSGGGLGLSYLTCYAGYALYQVFNQPTAFLVMVVITAIGAALSLRVESTILTGMALVGGFLTPLLIVSQDNQYSALFVYLILLNAGFLGIALFKRWTSILVECCIGTYTVFFIWVNKGYDIEKFWPTFGFLTTIFLLFLIVPYILSFLSKRTIRSGDVVLVVANAYVYFQTAYLLLTPAYSQYRGLFLLLAAAVILSGAAVLRRLAPEDNKGTVTLSMIGLSLVAFFMPSELTTNWIAIGWALLALLTVAFGTSGKQKAYRMFGVVIYILTAVYSFFAQVVSYRDELLFGIDTRFLTLLVVATATILGSYCYRKFGESFKTETDAAKPFLFITGVTLALFAVPIEVHGCWITVLWSLAAVAMIWLGTKDNQAIYRGYTFLMYCGITLQTIALVKKVEFLAIDQRFIAYLSLAAALLVGSYCYRIYGNTYKNETEFFKPTLLIAGLFFLTVAVPIQFDGAWISMIWAVVAAIIVVVGVRLESVPTRYYANFVFLLIAFRLFTFDLYLTDAISNTMLVANSRFLALVTVFLSLLVSAYAYRFDSAKKQLPTSPIETTFSICAHFVLMLLVTLEISLFFDKKIQLIAPSGIRGATYSNSEVTALRYGKSLAFSLAWAVLSAGIMIYGILMRYRVSRIIAIIGFSFVTLKVFVYDISQLSELYRILSFIALGVILLLVSFLFYRYKDKIKEFILVEKKEEKPAEAK